MKHKEIAPLRLKLLEQQGGLCAICNLPCSTEQAVLDHNHVTGYVRAVLHRGCNGAEGRIVNLIKRMGIKDSKAFLIGLQAYHELHADDQTGLLHPSHKTPEQKKALAKKRRLKKKLAAI